MRGRWGKKYVRGQCAYMTKNNNMRNATDVTVRWSTSDCQLHCFHFRLEVASPSLFSWPSAEISLISFGEKSAVYCEKTQKVSIQLVDKRSSDGHFRIELNSSVCALLAIFALQTEDRVGRVNVCFHISTERSIWCLNSLWLNRMATNIYFFKCQSRNNMLFCALFCVLVLRCRQRTTEIKELFYKAMMFKNNPVRHLNALG